MTIVEYDKLKRQIMLSVGASENYGQIVQTLKEFFKDDIDSIRRFEQITNIGQLLNILEIRDILSTSDVGPLKEIAQRLPNNGDLLGKIYEYEAAQIRSRDNGAPEVMQNSFNRQEVSSPLDNHPFGNLTERKKKRIIDTVVEEIGTDWRNLARNFKMIRECTIDEIDCYDTLEIKARKLMEVYSDKADPQRWFFVLCNALERSRRKDLSKSLQNIMAMNI